MYIYFIYIIHSIYVSTYVSLKYIICWLLLTFVTRLFLGRSSNTITLKSYSNTICFQTVLENSWCTSIIKLWILFVVWSKFEAKECVLHDIKKKIKTRPQFLWGQWNVLQFKWFGFCFFIFNQPFSTVKSDMSSVLPFTK